MRKTPNIQLPVTAYIFEYPEFAKMADTQLDIFWPHNEPEVAKDKQDLMTNLTPAEYHGVVTALKLFTKYELLIGNEYWLDRVMKAFPRPEIQRMAAAFGHVELNSHAPFYAKINEELGLATMEFYNSYVNDPVLVERMNFIDGLINNPDDLVSTAGFSMMEGAVLYSSFAFLKHFQSKGKNKIPTIVRGLNMSVRDENLHAVGGAALFRIAKKESDLSQAEEYQLQDQIKSLAIAVREHEHRIIDMFFEKGAIAGVTARDMKTFVDSRINGCLIELGYDPLFEVGENPIADWFYDGINKYQMNDFFSGVGREYTRGWNKKRFVWKTKGTE